MSSAPDIPVSSQHQPTPPPTWADLLGSVPSPKSLVAHLDRHVVGQQAAKRRLAVAVSNHFKRLADGERSTGRVTGPDPLSDAPDLMHVPIERSNVLLIGPTGSGKTLLVQALAKALNVPVVIGDATTFTEAGYVGDDVGSLLTSLYLASGGESSRTAGGIIFIDEIDEIRRYNSQSGTKDPTGEGVQHALLKMFECWVSFIPSKLGPRHPEAETVPFDTIDVLFICGGAFPGLDDIIARRLGRDAGMFGFGAPTIESQEDQDDLFRHVLPCDLEAFGMIPELVGRLPVIATLDDLGVDHLVRILTDPAIALLKQYRKLLRLQGADLDFTPEAIKEIARMAYDRGTGARGLRAVVEQVVEGVLFEVSEADRGQVFVIDEQVVKGEGEPGRMPIRQQPPLRSLVRRRVTG